MAQNALLPESGAAKLAITLTAVTAGASLGLFSATWLTAGLAAALPMLVCGVLLLEFGAFMWKGTPSAYMGALATTAGLYLFTLLGMSGVLPGPDETWFIAGLGAVSVLCVSVIIFSAVYLREDGVAAKILARNASAKPAAGRDAEPAQAASDGN